MAATERSTTPGTSPSLNPTSPDRAILTGIADQQESALTLLYNRYSGVIYAIALRITQDATRAEEVVQDVFYAVWRDARKFDWEREVCPWLLGIARHRAIDTTRGRHYWQHARTTRLYKEVVDQRDAVTDALLDEMQLQTALAQLPPDQQITIELAYYQGLTCIQIAAYQALPLGTVKTRLRLAQTKLRELLVR